MFNNKKSLFASLLVFFTLILVPFVSYSSQDLEKDLEKYPTTAEIKEKWNSKCYSCIVVAKVIDTFIDAGTRLYPVTSDAGRKILVFGFFIWIAIWGVKHLGSFSAASGTKMTYELIVMLLKIGFAYLVISVGIGTIASFVMEPILSAGADFAGVVLSNSPLSADVFLESTEAIKHNPSAIVSTDILNKIMLLAKKASKTVSTLMVLGSSLISFGFEFPLKKIIVPSTEWTIPIYDFVSIIIGAVFWVVGVMFSLSVCFYLVDISFKLGYAIIFLPIAIGLWPFPLKEAKNKVAVCISIAISGAGLFVLLSITVSVAMLLIDNAFGPGGMAQILEAIDNDNKHYVRQFFDITELNILIILFCVIAGFKIISKSEDFSNSFFSSPLSGKPMHFNATKVTDKLARPAWKKTKQAGVASLKGTGKALFAGGRYIKKQITEAKSQTTTPTVRDK